MIIIKNMKTAKRNESVKDEWILGEIFMHPRPNPRPTGMHIAIDR